MRQAQLSSGAICQRSLQRLAFTRMIAARLGLHKETVKQYRREGRLKVRYHPINEDNQFMYEDPDVLEEALDPAPTAARAEGAQYE